MTNMMMNGVVAINGGVGVMEIRQPLPQTVESVAQPVENLTVNAHISLRELKNTVAAVIEKKLPKYAQLKQISRLQSPRQKRRHRRLPSPQMLRLRLTARLQKACRIP